MAKALLEVAPELRGLVTDLVDAAVPRDVRRVAIAAVGLDEKPVLAPSGELGDVDDSTEDDVQAIFKKQDASIGHFNDATVLRIFSDWNLSDRLETWIEPGAGAFNAAVLTLFTRAKELGVELALDLPVPEGTRAPEELAGLVPHAPPGQRGVDLLHRLADAFASTWAPPRFGASRCRRCSPVRLQAATTNWVKLGELGKETYETPAQLAEAIAAGKSKGDVSDSTAKDLALKDGPNSLLTSPNPAVRVAGLRLLARCEELGEKIEFELNGEAPRSAEGLDALNRLTRALKWNRAEVEFAGKTLADWPDSRFYDAGDQPIAALKARRPKTTPAMQELVQIELRENLARLSNRSGASVEDKRAAVLRLFDPKGTPSELSEIIDAAAQALHNKELSPLAATQSQAFTEPLDAAIAKGFGSPEAGVIVAGLVTRQPAAELEAVLRAHRVPPHVAGALAAAAVGLKSLTESQLRFVLKDVLDDPKRPDFSTVALRSQLELDSAAALRSFKTRLAAGQVERPAAELRAVFELAERSPGAPAKALVKFVEDLVQTSALPRAVALAAVPASPSEGLLEVLHQRVDAASKRYHAAAAGDRPEAAAALARAIELTLEPGGSKAAGSRALESLHPADPTRVSLVEADALKSSVRSLGKMAAKDFSWPKRPEAALELVDWAQFDAVWQSATADERVELEQAWTQAAQALLASKGVLKLDDTRRMLTWGKAYGLLDRKPLVARAETWVADATPKSSKAAKVPVSDVNLASAQLIFHELGLTSSAAAIHVEGNVLGAAFPTVPEAPTPGPRPALGAALDSLNAIGKRSFAWPPEAEARRALVAWSTFEPLWEVAKPAEKVSLEKAWTRAYQGAVTSAGVTDEADLGRMLKWGTAHKLLDEKGLVERASQWEQWAVGRGPEWEHYGGNLRAAEQVQRALGRTQPAAGLAAKLKIHELMQGAPDRVEWASYEGVWNAASAGDRAAIESAFEVPFANQLRASIARELPIAWTQALDSGQQMGPDVLKRIVNTALTRAAAQIEKIGSPGLREKVKATLLNPAPWLAQTPSLDLTFGENIVRDDPATRASIPAEKRGLINSIVSEPEVGSPFDTAMLRNFLAALNPQILHSLATAGYKIALGRNNLTNAHASLRGKRASSGNAAGLRIDHAEGVHSVSAEGRIIAARSWMQDGKLVLDVATLLHELGHAYDMTLAVSNLAGSKTPSPLNEQPDVAAAYAAEHKFYRDTYFHDQKEFVAESIGRYFLNPEQFAIDFPLTFAAFEKAIPVGLNAVDSARLIELNRSMLTDVPVTTSVKPEQVLTKFETINSIRSEQGNMRQPYLVGLEGELPAAEAVAKYMAAQLRHQRDPGTSPGSIRDGYSAIDATLFNDAAELTKVLDDYATGSGGLAFLSGLSQIPADSSGFAVLKRFFKEHGDQVPLVLHGTATERAAFLKHVPSELKADIKLSALTPVQTAELVRRHVANDGYFLSEEALAALAQKAKGGYAEAMSIWGQIKQAAFDRVAKYSPDVLKGQREGVHYVLKRDVEGATVKPKSSAAFDTMIDLDEPKAKLNAIVQSAITQERKIRAGMKLANVTNTNLIFSGNPGTGKTEMAKMAAQALGKEAVLLTAADFKGADGPKKMADLFRANKGSLIFIDEAHQLPKEVFEAMVAFTADHDYVDTPVILAGYPKQIVTMLQQDKGGQSRFQSINFPDYSRPALGRILDRKLALGELHVTPEVRAAILDAVDRRQRTLLNPDNGRSVEKVLAATIQAQEVRLANVHDDAALHELTLADVPPPPPLTPTMALAKLQEAPGLDDLKSMIWGMSGVIASNRARGVDPLEGVLTNFILTADTYARRDEVLRYLSDYLYSEGFLNEPQAERHGGNQFQGWLHRQLDRPQGSRALRAAAGQAHGHRATHRHDGCRGLRERSHRRPDGHSAEQPPIQRVLRHGRRAGHVLRGAL